MKTNHGVVRLAFPGKLLAAATRKSLPSVLALLLPGLAAPSFATPPDVSGSYAYASLEFGFGHPLDYQNRWGLGTEFLVLESQYIFGPGTFTEDVSESSIQRQLGEYLLIDGTDRMWVNEPIVVAMSLSELLNGTFTVSPRGRVNLTSDDEDYSLQASEDGELLFQFGDELDPESVLLGGGLGVRKGSAMNAASATGDWVLVELGMLFHDNGQPPPPWTLPPGSWGRVEESTMLRSELAFDGTTATFSGTAEQEIHYRTCTEDQSQVAPGPDTITMTRFVLTTDSESEPSSGTYIVGLDGALQLDFPPDDSLNGHLASNGNVMVLSDLEVSGMDSHAEGLLAIGVRKPTSFTEAQAVGHYQVAVIEVISRGPEATSFPSRQIYAGLVRLELKADGTFRLREDMVEARQWIDNDQFQDSGNTVARNHVEMMTDRWIEFITGTWSASSDGVLNIQFMEEDESLSLDFQFSADGQALLGHSSESSSNEAVHELIFGIRIPPPPPGSATALHLTSVAPDSPPGFRCTIEGAPTGAPVQILGSDNMRHWQILGTTTINSPPDPFDDPDFGTTDHRFFRLVPDPDNE